MRIKEIRLQKGLRQKELASAIGVSQPTVSDWEAGHKVPSGKSLLKLAEYLNVSVEELTGIAPLNSEEKKEPLQNEQRPDEEFVKLLQGLN